MDATVTRFDQELLTFSDPDGLALELVGSGRAQRDSSIDGFHGVTLSESGYESTAALLTAIYGFTLVGQEGNRFRYGAPAGSPGRFVDLLCQPDARGGSMGAGTVHHVAFRAESDAAQREWRAELSANRFNVTPVLDRQYFQSIYFREPGGVLFEIATDPPGFAIDESFEELGTHLKLPDWLEPRRAEIESILPSLAITTTMTSDFVHRFVPGQGSSMTLLLLHGTGGDEDDLLPIGRALAPGAALLSPRGKVIENGMPRFFRRLQEGVFDLEDLQFRAHELAGFVREAAGEYGFDPARVFAMGYSNGANIAAVELLLYPGLLSGAVLFRSMFAFAPEPLPKLPATPVLMLAGKRDPIISPALTEKLAGVLSQAGARVEVQWREAGHELTPQDFQAGKQWLGEFLQL